MWIICLLFIVGNNFIVGNEVESNDENIKKQLSDIIKKSKFVAVLFSEQCCTCTECVEAEALLSAMNEELLKEFQIVTVKLIAQDDVAKSYGITQRPTLLYLRSERPILYDGKFEPEELTEWLRNSREPTVRILDDATFEHLTQAATGATTGDWLVTFHDSECKQPMALHVVLDSVAFRLKGRGNVALVNSETSTELKERFSISKCPTTILFRLGKMYFFELPSFSSGALRSFMEGFYKNARSAPVPPVPSPFDKLVDQSVQYLKNHSWVPLLGALAIFGMVALISSRKQKTSKTE